jgi:hypothetical protein
MGKAYTEESGERKLMTGKELYDAFESRDIDFSTLSPSQLVEILIHQRQEAGYFDCVPGSIYGLDPDFEREYARELKDITNNHSALFRKLDKADRESLHLTTEVAVRADLADMVQKVDPYLRPVYDALYDCFGADRTNELIALRKVEIAPLAFMRGRTLSHSVIVLDEAQNCTLLQLKMFLTRLGKDSRMCLSGDASQIDLPPGRSGLKRTMEILSGIDGIGVVEFGREDIVRHPMVTKIVAAFDRAQKEKDA